MANTTRQLALGLIASALVTGTAVAQEQVGEFLHDRAPQVPTAAFVGDLVEIDHAPSVTYSSNLVDTVFYEDFSDSLDGWTTVGTLPVDTVLWQYVTDTVLPGTFFGARVISSPTVANGYAAVNYDFYETGGNGLGPARLPFDQSLISPSISFAELDSMDQYVVSFHGGLRFCCTEAANPALIAFSTDGGETFEAETVAAPTLDVNATGSGYRFVRIPRRLAGEEDVRIRFRYRGGTFYYWALDDVLVEPLPGNELSLSNDFYATVPNAITPVNQTEGQNIYFVTDLQNNGADDLIPQVVVRVLRFVPGGTELYYTDTLIYPVLAQDETFFDNPFESFVGMPTEPGNYVTVYDLTAQGATLDDDADPSNNRFRYDFTVSDTADSYRNAAYNRANEFPNGFRPAATGNQNEFEVGNIYYTPDLGEQGVQIDTVTAGFFIRDFDDSSGEAFVEVRTYGYRGDLNDDNLPNVGEDGETGDELEFVRLGSRFLVIEGGQADTAYTISLPPGEDELTGDPVPVTITPEDGYIGYAVALYYAATNVQGERPDRLFVGNDPEFNDQANQSVIDSLLLRGIIDDRGEQRGSFLLNRGTVNTQFFQFGQGNFLNSTISYVDTLLGSSSVEQELPTTQFEVAPNPANATASVSYEFDGVTGDVQFSVTNGIGQQVEAFERAALSSGVLRLNTSAYNEGVYFVTATDRDGRSTTRRFSVQH